MATGANAPGYRISFSTQQDEAAGRANYEAFSAAMREWLPPAPLSWDSLSPYVKQGWIAGAIAARAAR